MTRASLQKTLVTVVLVALAILAFAGNSLLTRQALAGGAIAPGAFVGLRLASGAVLLALLLARRPAEILPRRADLPGIGALLLYALAFTWAYLGLGAATGALILFSSVQLTLVLLAHLRGTRLTGREAAGMVLALAGLALLLAPGLTAPPLGGALLMALAGVGWGFYTLLGRGAVNPLALTARNFIGAAPVGLVLLLLGLTRSGPLQLEGVLLAIASGAVTSGIGYAVWYAVVPCLSVAMAGSAQLLVPLVTAAGGVLWLGEPLTLHFAIVCLLILTGIWLTRRPPARPAITSVHEPD